MQGDLDNKNFDPENQFGYLPQNLPQNPKKKEDIYQIIPNTPPPGFETLVKYTESTITLMAYLGLIALIGNQYPFIFFSAAFESFMGKKYPPYVPSGSIFEELMNRIEKSLDPGIERDVINKIKEQNEKLKDPIKEVGKILELSPLFKASLLKNEIAVYDKVFGTGNEVARSKYNEYLAKNQADPMWSAAFNVPLNENEIDSIFRNLSFPEIKRLINAIDSSPLNKFPEYKDLIDKIKRAESEGEFYLCYHKLEGESINGISMKDVFLALVQKSGSLEQSNLEQSIKSSFLKRLKQDSELYPQVYKNTIKAFVLNANKKKVQIHSARGIPDLNYLNLHNVNPANFLQKAKNLRNLLSRMHNAGLTSTGDNKSEDVINISDQNDLVATFIHEANHENNIQYKSFVEEVQNHLSKLLIQNLGGIYKSEKLVKLLEENRGFAQKSNSDVVRAIKKSYQRSGSEKNLKEILKILGFDDLSPEFIKQLSLLITDTSIDLHIDGEKISNFIPRLDNDFIKIYWALKLPENLYQFPERMKLLLSLESKISENPEIQNMFNVIQSINNAYIYNKKNIKDEEVVRVLEEFSRIEQLLPKNIKDKIYGLVKDTVIQNHNTIFGEATKHSHSHSQSHNKSLLSHKKTPDAYKSKFTKNFHKNTSYEKDNKGDLDKEESNAKIPKQNANTKKDNEAPSQKSTKQNLRKG